LKFNIQILYFEDIAKCMEETGVDGVMSAEANLYNPAIFADKHPLVWEITDEYLNICAQHSTQINMIRSHLFKLLQPCINSFPEIREMLAKACTIPEFHQVSSALKGELETEYLASGWDTSIKSSEIANDEHGFKNLPRWVCQPHLRERLHRETGISIPTIASAEEKAILPVDGLEIVQLRATRKAEKRKRKEEHKLRQQQTSTTSNRRRPICSKCLNVISLKCSHQLCKGCCRVTMKENAAALNLVSPVPPVEIDANGFAFGKPVKCEAHGFGWKPELKEHQVEEAVV
jgi:tRNA-dihydrouridine synthase 1